MAEKNDNTLVLSNAPHVRTRESVSSLMWLVVLALLPAALFSAYNFGINAFISMGVSIVAAVLAEAVFQKIMNNPVTVSDGSAVITGLLVAMNVPPQAPIWVGAIGSAFAIIIVKQLFGGLGYNVFNPALAARAFLLASWPVHMTTAWHQFAGTTVLAKGIENTLGVPKAVFDSITQATPLAVLKEAPTLLKQYGLTLEQLNDFLFSPQMIKQMFFGNIGGCIGETSAGLLLLGGLFMIWRRVISWHIPVAFIGTVAVLVFAYYAAIGYPNAPLVTLAHVLSGGLFLGAFFMATDYVSSPVSAKGMIAFGMGCGFITFVIRVWGGYPEGVSYAILLMNAGVPLIDRFTKPRVFGTGQTQEG